MNPLKRYFKRNSHSIIFKNLAGFGRALNRFYENRNHDLESNGELTVLKKIKSLNPSVVFDGGANVGKYSLLINKFLPNCKVYAFEPVEDTFEIMKKNVSEYDNITPVNYGLFSSKCTKEINLFSSNTHSSLYDIKGISYEAENKVEIKLITGDSYIQDNNIPAVDFLKIDVEGAEYEVIKGFEQSLQKGIIKAIQFEYGYINITTKKLLVDFYTLLEDLGYVVGKIFPKQVEFRKYNYLHEDFIGPNFIAVHKSEKDLIKMLANK